MLQTDFVQRVRACERRLYRVARTMLPQACDCEDAVQEALLRAWDRLDTLRQEAYFETWLIRILINQCKTFYRRRPPEPAARGGSRTRRTPAAGAVPRFDRNDEEMIACFTKRCCGSPPRSSRSPAWRFRGPLP